ncbi:permease prefix domain 1-containing protein [Mesobacillus jeotgali]|uniref:permease prefix domain 1-containing protein n=1 Tax=Mesobacillus jeotgali TaxID=129985 RepID=UPI000C81730A|nr:permease prefix domain 1-containing protein [Mesobacillus jeotgali]
MSIQVSIKQFDDYIKKLVRDLHLEEEEKRELEEEWTQHLYDHFSALQKQGVEKMEAIQTVLEQFGDMQKIQTEVNQSYPSAIKSHIQKESVIAILCIIASVIGPMILIGAHFQPYFVFAPLIALVFAYLVHRFIAKRQSDWRLSGIGLIAIYVFFFQLFNRMYGSLSLDLYGAHLFTLDWNRLTGSGGLFEFVTIHMMWYVIIAMQFIGSNNYIPVWKRILNSSFQYWAMLLIGVFVAMFQSSGEWSVLFINIFLLYAFLQHTISIKGITIFSQKVSRMFYRQSL